MAEVKVIWLGHAAFELDYNGKVKILVDPFLVASPKKADEFKDVDLILVTHAHQDHVGETCEILKNNPKAKIVAIYELASHLSEKCGVKEFI
ncbi:TPA: MBL fold metallo-hydrolase, partial [Candidatus Geothermarchaeota archaeon]|nr:MBL fold metallo-hydrolase [Candidatus Geothermarchaeota archaeon]